MNDNGDSFEEYGGHAAEIHKAGLPVTADNLWDWKGLKSSKIVEAIDRGFTNAEDFKRYGHAATDFSEIEDLDEPALHLIEVGFKLKEIRRLLRAVEDGDPKTDWFELSRLWHREGVPTNLIIRWMQAKASSRPSDLRDYKFAKAELSPEQTDTWIAIGLDVAHAVEAASRNISAPLVIPWIEHGLSVDSACSWIEHGFDDPEVALEWEKFFEASEAVLWAKTGLTPKVAKRRSSAGMSPPESRPIAESE